MATKGGFSANRSSFKQKTSHQLVTFTHLIHPQGGEERVLPTHTQEHLKSSSSSSLPVPKRPEITLLSRKSFLSPLCSSSTSLSSPQQPSKVGMQRRGCSGPRGAGGGGCSGHSSAPGPQEHGDCY